MANVLVTGGAGFMGSHVAEELVRARHCVWVLDDLSGGFRASVPRAAHFVQGSILDRRLLADLFRRHRFAYVFHLAAYAAEGLSHFIKCFNYENNLVGSVNLINLAVLYRVKCFVFTSSIAVYGRQRPPMTEAMTPRPEDPYGIAKYAVEQELAVSQALFGLPYIVFRPHNVYGERQNIGDRYRNVVGIFMNQILQGKPMTVFGDGRQRRAFSYIGDVAPVIARAIRVPRAYNRVFNVGADTPYTVNRLAREVARAMGVVPRIRYLPRRHEVDEAFSDHSLVRRIFKASSQVGLREGLARMTAWVARHGARKSRPFEHIEIARHLPRVWRVRQ